MAEYQVTNHKEPIQPLKNKNTGNKAYRYRLEKTSHDQGFAFEKRSLLDMRPML